MGTELFVAIRLFLIHGPATPVIITACRCLGVALNLFAGVGLLQDHTLTKVAISFVDLFDEGIPLKVPRGPRLVDALF